MNLVLQFHPVPKPVKKPSIVKVISLYKCENEGCNKEFPIDPEATEEPVCSHCEGPYFSHIKDIEIKI